MNKEKIQELENIKKYIDLIFDNNMLLDFKRELIVKKYISKFYQVPEDNIKIVSKNKNDYAVEIIFTQPIKYINMKFEYKYE